ncbi:uncharacterized protein [Amphiura filiformis]|uniref:uncharacterized protein n=1 Tax=Amphiura filiformis TaxID=82378 RepID=UPI003B213C2E
MWRDNKLSIYNVSASFCNDLDAPVGGWYKGESTFFGESLTFGCNNGVELIGNDDIRCIIGSEQHEVRWSAPLPYCFGVTAAPTPAKNRNDIKSPDNPLLQENGVLVWSIAGVAGFLLIVTLLTVIFSVRSKNRRNSADAEEHSVDFDLEPAGPTGTYRHSMNSLHLLDTIQDNKENVTQEKQAKTVMYLREEMKEGVGMQTNALAVIPLRDEEDMEWDEDIELDSDLEIDPRTSSIEHVGRTAL